MRELPTQWPYDFLMQARPQPYFALSATILFAAALTACSSSKDPGRLLLTITVAPATADAQSYPNGQVTFTATGTFSVAPSPGPVPSTAPYSGQFFVANPTNPPLTMATVIATGDSTVTVQCASGVSGIVPVVASASANNDTSVVITGSAQLTCP